MKEVLHAGNSKRKNHAPGRSRSAPQEDHPGGWDGEKRVKRTVVQGALEDVVQNTIVYGLMSHYKDFSFYCE